MNKKIENFDFIDFKDDREDNNTVVADTFAIVWRHRFWFGLSVVIMMILGILFFKCTPERYSRRATIIVKDSPGGGGLGDSFGFQNMFSSGNSSVNNEVGILKSRQLMMKVVEQLKLETNYQVKKGLKLYDLYTQTPIEVEYLDDISKNSDFEMELTIFSNNSIKLWTEVEEIDDNGNIINVEEVNMEGSLDSEISTPYGVIKISPTIFMSNEYVQNTIFITKGNTKEVAKAYMENSTIEIPEKTSSLVVIAIVDVNSQRAEDIINTLISCYERNTIDDKNKIIENTITFINDKIAVLENSLELIDSDIEDYKKRNKLTDITSISSMHLQNYSKLDAQAIEIENQLGIANYMKEYLTDSSKQGELIPVNIGINNAGIEGQANNYNDAMNRRNRLLTNSSANSPIIKDIQVSLVSIRASILSAIDNLIASLEIQLARYDNEEKKSSSNIANVSSQHKYMINIERQLKTKEELYLYLLKKQEESEIQLTTTESNCLIVDCADGLIEPVYPKKIQVLFICLLIGGLIPTFFIYIYSLLNTNIYTQKDIKDRIDIPFIGELPQEKMKGHNGIVIEDGKRDVVNETFRLLRDNVRMMASNSDRGKVILTTSFNPGAGKTFITSNFAVTMSLSSQKIVLVDIDIRKASLTKRLGFDLKQPGLSAYLSGRVNSIEQITRQYNGGALSVITCGAIPPNPVELLENGRLDTLISELRDSYDYIILDSAPYGLVSDTGICAKHADMTILVVRSGLFDKRQLPFLAEVYRSGKLPKMSILLNGVNLNKVSHGYGYGYGYGNKVNKNFRYYVRKVLGI